MGDKCGGNCGRGDGKAHSLGYAEGRRRTLINLLSHTISELTGYTRPEDNVLVHLARAIEEREEAVAVLREVCKKHGDNDWTENLHLADVIERHLVRHL